VCKKLISVVSVSLVLILASASLGINIGDFEDNMDGWRTASSAILTGYSTNGATLNQKSLWIESTNGNQDALILDLKAQGLVDEFRNNLKISIDITRLLSEWVESSDLWCDLFVMINAGYDDESGSWALRKQLTQDAKWNRIDGEEPLTFVYDYSLVLSNIDFNNLGYLRIIIGTNWGGYDPGGVYYIDNIQMFGGGAAYAPAPTDGAKAVPLTTTLGWTSGVNADKHDIYLGTSFDDVNQASRTDVPDGVTLIQDQESNSYDPGGLVPGTTYFWRVDEVSGTDTWKGDTWSFATKYPGTAYIIGDWEDNMDGWTIYGGNPATAGYSTSGATLNNKSLMVQMSSPFYWGISLLNPDDETFAQFLANDTFSIDVTFINEDWIGLGSWAQIYYIAFNANDIGWNEVTAPIDDTSNPDEPGAWDPSSFPESDTRTIVWDYSDIPLEEISEEGRWFQFHISLWHDEGFENAVYYLDNAKLYSSKPASKPFPAYQATDVKTEPTLSWTSGSHAVSHNVYISTNYNDINDVNAANLADYPDVTFENVSGNSFNPGLLSFSTTYFWRVDEVNDAHPEMLWEGPIWSFTTGDYIVLDDFEAYNDINEGQEGCNRIYLTWLDGYNNPNVNGSTIGYAEPDFANDEHVVETDIVHGGSQSAPFLYNNTVASYSEVTLSSNNMALGNNWSQYGLNTLSLWLYGDPNNPATELFYVKLSNSKIVYDGDVADLSAGEWIQWNIDLSDFGVNLSNITQLGIGTDKIGAVGSEGILFIDDIRLRYVEQ